MALTEALTDAQVSNTLTASALGAGSLSADAAGRAFMATNYFNAATFLDKFAASSVDVSAGGGKITGALAVANGGTGSANAADARTALGLAIGTNVQAYDATLASLAALGTAADRLAYTTALDTWAEATITAAGRNLLDDADAAAQRTTLGLAIGTNVQAYDATLASLAALGTAADRMAYTTALDTWAETPITAAGRNLIDDADAATQRTTLGLAIGTNVQAYDATLASLAALGTAADRMAYTTALDTWAEATITAAGRNLLDDADAAAQRVTLGLELGVNVQAYSAVLAAIVAGNIDAAAVAAMLGTDSMTVANAADIIQDSAIVGDHIAPQAIDVSHLAQIADTAVGAITSLGADVVMKLVQPDGVTADLDFTAPADLGNFEIIDAWMRPIDVNGANANTTQLQTAAAAAITDAMSTNGVASGGIVRATSMNDVNAAIASGGTIRVRRVKAGGNVAAHVFVRCIKRA